MKLEMSSLKKAIDVLNRSVQVYHALPADAVEDLRNTVQAGVIQNFEVAYELCWKMMKRWLEVNLGKTDVDGVTRRQLFRLSAEHLLINDVDQWMEYHRSRNETSHTYDGSTADDVFSVSGEFLETAKRFLVTIESRND